MTPNRPSGAKTAGTILMLSGGVTIALGFAFAVLIEIMTNCPEHPAPDAAPCGEGAGLGWWLFTMVASLGSVVAGLGWFVRAVAGNARSS
jgi:hypothetical protein